MTRKEKIRDIKIICEKCGCNEEQKKRHFQLFVNENWQPHVSLRFKKWWFNQQEFKDSQTTSGEGISPIDAQNTARYWDAYMDAKATDLA